MLCRYHTEVAFYFLLGHAKMQNYAFWWPVVGGVSFLAVIILGTVLTRDHSPTSKTHKQKQKKSQKRSALMSLV